MVYEVELKFPLADPHTVIGQLKDLRVTMGDPIEQSDRYFNHPARDFAETDEAFRVRSVGDENCVTYKGPVIDRDTKMRREIEVPFAQGRQSADQIVQMLTLLGFRYVREVRKQRTPMQLCWSNRTFELAFDVLPDLGSYLEIELMAQDSEKEQAKQAILNLATHLKLTAPERRSYLELVIEHSQRLQFE